MAVHKSHDDGPVGGELLWDMWDRRAEHLRCTPGTAAQTTIFTRTPSSPSVGLGPLAFLHPDGEYLVVRLANRHKRCVGVAIWPHRVDGLSISP